MAAHNTLLQMGSVVEETRQQQLFNVIGSFLSWDESTGARSLRLFNPQDRFFTAPQNLATNTVNIMFEVDVGHGDYEPVQFSMYEIAMAHYEAADGEWKSLTLFANDQRVTEVRCHGYHDYDNHVLRYEADTGEQCNLFMEAMLGRPKCIMAVLKWGGPDDRTTVKWCVYAAGSVHYRLPEIEMEAIEWHGTIPDTFEN